MTQPGQAFRTWISRFGLTFRVKAAFGVSINLRLSVYV